MNIEVKQYKEGMELKGFIANMPNEVYHEQRDFISNSGLSQIAQSPAHYFFNERKETRALVVGTAFHMYMLERGNFEDYYIRFPQLKNRQEKAFNEAAKEFGKERILTGPEIEQLEKMIRGLYVDPRNRSMLDDIAYTELSLFTQCPTSGAKVRVRYDALTHGGIAIDPKTTRNASQEQFSRAIFDYRYHVQDALYSDAFEWETGKKLSAFVFMAIESAAPHLTMPYFLDNISKTIGRYEYGRCIDIYRSCLDSGDWGGYERVGELANLNSVPDWAINRFDNEIGLSGFL